MSLDGEESLGVSADAASSASFSYSPEAIDLAYLAFLDRPANDQEHEVWKERLRDGWSFAQIVQALAESPEARDVIARPLQTALMQAYRTVMIGSPDEAQEQAWAIALESGRRFEELLAEIARSSPSDSAQNAANAFFSSENEEDAFRSAVGCIYTILTGRPARDDEVDVWANSAREPNSILKIFQEMQKSPTAQELERVRTERALSLASRWALGSRAASSRVKAWSARVRRGETFAYAVLQLDGEAARTRSLGRAQTRRLITEIYRLTVERLPSDADIATWSYQFSKGVAPNDFLIDMARGPEASSIGRKPLDFSLFTQDRLRCGVSLVLQLILHRTTDADDIEHWVGVLKTSPSYLDFLDAVTSSVEGQAVTRLRRRATVSRIYELCLGRTAASEEIDGWLAQIDCGMTLDQVLMGVDGSTEAKAVKAARRVGPELNDAQFAQNLYDVLLERGAAPSEIQHWVERLGAGTVRRDDLLTAFFNERASGRLSEARRDPSVTSIMGTFRTINLEAWRQLKETPESKRDGDKPKRQRPLRLSRAQPTILVSCIASLYRGRQFMPQFLENIVNQTIFRDYCELIIVDADSPEGEFDQIEPYLRDFPNIRYKRINYRIGIYDAWNVGLGLAQGQYITNTNADDLRRHDSLEAQASILDKFRFVDVVYQDFYYTYEWDLSFEEIAGMGVVSTLPIISPTNMLMFNSPHNAPMWRRSIHDEIGLFDTQYKSAGDYEFWLRCMAANKNFYKVNDPHVSYYHNPKGLSTQAESLGIEEAKRITRKYGPLLLRNAALTPLEFIERYHVAGLSADAVAKARSKFDLLQEALIATAASFVRAA